jgi:hypothetical protein
MTSATVGGTTTTFTEQSESVLQNLNLNGKSPEGQIFHAEGPLESGGTWVMDGWETPGHLQAFIENKLMPAMQQLGVNPPQPTLLPMRVMLTPEQLRHLD